MKTWQILKSHPHLWQRYFVREKILREIRSFYNTLGFHEIETPILLSHPAAESYIDVFETSLLNRNRQGHKAYLSTSPETSLKKLLAAGLGDCFSITKSFRNTETQSQNHNPEFTILEWYRVNCDYLKIMEDCQDLILTVMKHLDMGTVLRYQGKSVNMEKPWDRLTVAQAFEKYSGIGKQDLFHNVTLRNIAKLKGYTVLKNTTWENIFNQIFLNEIEPNLGHGRPVFLYEFPSRMAALSKTKTDDPTVSERFEFYIAGLEMGDCYSELTDWMEQEKRFRQELAELKRLGKTEYEYDHDFIDALKSGLPSCSGIAVGVDRLVMLMADVSDIADTMFFPVRDLFPQLGE